MAEVRQTYDSIKSTKDGSSFRSSKSPVYVGGRNYHISKEGQDAMKVQLMIQNKRKCQRNTFHRILSFLRDVVVTSSDIRKAFRVSEAASIFGRLYRVNIFNMTNSLVSDLNTNQGSGTD
ncbi:hypothetical protein AWC38_SpisGene23653 [Stylophora pistillata]|uniref:Uncharacterized protein n=1 Tax=Stylophora pistillata TaxID=50429 RepID=A0A2B4R6G9_STYPI|nr:hypothetical protein AWC38_SpisGene23653 [Stylophora pistillata]